MQKKILFISQSAGRTGAPLMLLNLLGWFKENSRLSFEVLLADDGPLRHNFATLANVHIFPKAAPPAKGLVARIAQQLGFADSEKKAQSRLLAQLRKSGIGLIYSNTIVNGRVLEALESLSCPAITHVHELDYWIEQCGEENLQQVKSYTNYYIAASGAVKENLVRNYGLPEDKIEVVHSFIPTSGLRADPTGIRQQLGIPKDAFVVLGSGYETWRKGKDLFVLLAAQVNRNLQLDSQVHFVWVGGWQKLEDHRNIMHDVRQLKMNGLVHFTGEVSNPLDYFTAGNLFAMVSREDPFPLVCLEAALLDNPILCFADSGGMSEFVEDDAGFIVPYLDIDKMADKVIALIKDEKLRKEIGERAAKKVREKHGISVAAPQILELINQLL